MHAALYSHFTSHQITVYICDRAVCNTQYESNEAHVTADNINYIISKCAVALAVYYRNNLSAVSATVVLCIRWEQSWS